MSDLFNINMTSREIEDVYFEISRNLPENERENLRENEFFPIYNQIIDREMDRAYYGEPDCN